jgi:hypothetical protein
VVEKAGMMPEEFFLYYESWIGVGDQAKGLGSIISLLR